MLFRTHLMFSVATYFLLSYYIAMPLYVLMFILLSTVFVDIDARNSKAGNHWYLRPLQFLTKHRGLVHSLFLAFLISLSIGFFNQWAGFGFFAGYVSHLFLDCFTLAGIKLFWPFSWKIKGFIKSGGIIEQIIFVLLLLGNIFIVGKMFLNTLF
jgi:inner membrane protein